MISEFAMSMKNAPTSGTTMKAFVDDRIAANTIFELRSAVDDISRIVDVTLNLSSECATETHGKSGIQGQTGTTFGTATIPTDITWLLPTGC